jgi:hypothetical protein
MSTDSTITGAARAPAELPEVPLLGGVRWAVPTQGSRGLGRLLNAIRRIAVRSSADCRSRRGRLFVERLQPTAKDQILDLGGGRGGYMGEILPYRDNVTIADLDSELLKTAAEKYGFATLHLDGSETFPVADRAYDVVFCSSVIEHISGPRGRIFAMDSAQFAASARAAQANFAAEVRRVAKRYFVQTPYKYFPIEPHSFLPFFVVWLPRRWQIVLLAFFGRYWIKSVQADFHLLTIRDMRALFPDAEIVLERYCGFIKSIVAIKN